MRTLIFEGKSSRKHKPERIGIPWADNKGYVRKGVAGGILDHGPKHSKNCCYLVSQSTGRRIRVRYRSALHSLVCSHIGKRVIISGTRYYDNSGTLDSMDTETVERNEMKNKENYELRIGGGGIRAEC